MAESGNDVVINVLLGIEDANKRLASLEKTVNKFTDNFTAGAKKSSGSWDTFVGFIEGRAVEKVLGKAADAARFLWDTFIVDGVKAAQESEEALNGLNVSLSITGNYSRSTSRDLVAFADGLQATTKFENDAIIKSMGLLESLSGLDKNGLKKATKSALDMSAALGLDLDTSMELLGKAAQGEIGTLSRYGLVVQKGSNNAETFARVLDVVNTKFGGAAAGQVHTYAGALAQAQNYFNDLQETTGNFIVQNPVVIKLINDATAGFKQAAIWVEKNKTTVLDFVDTGLVGLVKGFGYVLIGTDGVYRAFKGLAAVTGLAFDAMVASVASWALNFTTSAAFALGWIPGLGPQLKQAQADVKSFSDATVDQMHQDAGAVVDTFSNEGPIGKAGDAILVYGDKLAAYGRAHHQLMEQAPRDTQNMVRKEKDFIGQLVAFYSEANSNRVEDFKATLGTIATLSQNADGALFEIGKAAAIAQATIDGIAAVQKALAAAPPPFNFALATLVGVATAANVAKIASQSPPKFEEGGIVPGSSYYGDRVAVMANSREMMLTMEQQASLFSAIQSGDLGGGEIHLHVGTVDSEARVSQLMTQIAYLARNRRVPFRTTR